MFETNYSKFINKLLKVKKKKNKFKVIDLFSGCGGLALGFEAAGFKTIGYEIDKIYCETYEKNLDSTCHNIDLKKGSVKETADIIIGGPPCQPFSVGGKQKGIMDSRDGFPVFLDLIKNQKPKMFVLENVRGLLYQNKWYFEKILKFISNLGYKVNFELINTSNYFVPQNRERLFLVGHKNTYEFPTKQNTKITALDALGGYFNYAPKNSLYLTKSMDKYIKKYENASRCKNPRDLIKEKPSRTVTCRNLAGSTGDMMRIKLRNGKRRRIFVEEAARLQSFPDWFKFCGSNTNKFYQIGNAVPPLFSYQLANSILEVLTRNEKEKKKNIFDKFNFK